SRVLLAGGLGVVLLGVGIVYLTVACENLLGILAASPRHKPANRARDRRGRAGCRLGDAHCRPLTGWRWDPLALRCRSAVARLVGINHVALEVGDLDEALAWYGRLFELKLRGRAGKRMAFIDMGDQFIALASGRTQPSDGARHFGLVVDDKEAVREHLREEGVPVAASGSLDF